MTVWGVGLLLGTYGHNCPEHKRSTNLNLRLINFLDFFEDLEANGGAKFK